MRVLLVVPPLAGHIAPLRGVAAALSSRGHSVAWCGPVPEVSTLVTGRVFPAGDSAPFSLALRPPELRGFAALKYLWESYLVPLADTMAPGVAAAVSSFVPDVVAPIRDDQSMLARQVTSASAGVRIRFDRAKASDIRKAIEAVSAFRPGAARVRDSFTAAGGATEAATHLESLAACDQRVDTRD